TATGQGVDGDGNPVGGPQSDSDPSFYFGANSGISIEKFTNGVDASAAPGPSIATGDAVEWTYVVTNLGNVTLANVSVSDDQGVAVTCPMDSLAVGESMTCSGSGTATAGQYMNLGTATGQGVDGDGNPVGGPQTDSDPSFYFGASGGIGIEKFTNGVDASAAPGPSIATGDAVEWTYVVTNLGNISLTGVSVSDDKGVVVSCPMDTLAAGESMTCTGSGTAISGQYMNLGTVTGQGVDGDGNPVGGPLTDSDPSFYFGANSGISIEKFTNGVDAAAAPGPSVAVGAAVEWTYVVTNLGNVSLTGVSVSDDQGVAVSCPMSTLAAGESMTCTGSGTATSGQYMNLGTATGQGVDDNGNPVGQPQTDSDPSFYFGVASAIGIEKFTNGTDVTDAPGPYIGVGNTVEWTYVVTNLGNVTLASVVVSDDQGVGVSCPMDTLAVGESMTCTGSGPATAGQYMNIGSVSGQGVDDNGNPLGAPQTDSDVSFYFGGVTKLTFEKFTNGQDADEPTGPEITVGNAVEWTYVVLNDGNVTISNVNVTDDQGVVVTCPLDTLAPGESMTCVGSGIATIGQYANLGTATAQGVDNNGVPFGPGLSASDPSHYLGLALPTAALGDFVFEDRDRDGIQDDDEPGIPGVTVNLWTDDNGDGLPDTQVATTTTGPNGEYLFTELDPNLVYIVQFIAAPGQQITTPGVGDSATDSNPAADTGITGPVTLNPGQTDPTIDAGIFFLTGSISIEKSTNGEDADAAPGPEISVGAAVLWDYTVTNTGETTLTNISVSDDQGVAVICPATELAEGASFVCSGEGVATAGQYMNLGSVTAQPVDNGQPFGGTVSDSDASHYVGVNVCMPGFVLDQFSHVSYDNNDGDMQWAGPWTEHDPLGGGASSGNVMIDNGVLILNDYPNSHTEPSALRQVNLDGYPSAMLMFNWSTSQEVGPEDTAVVEISSDGGLSYTVLKTFSDLHGANSGTESFNISAYISSQTVVRFRIAEKFGARWDKFMVDNVRIDKKCENTQLCEATSSAGHAFWMKGFNNPTDTDRFNLEPGAQFEQFDDGTATLTGTIVDDARPNRRFEVSMSFAGRTLDPPVGSPKNGFNADPAGWEYYPDWTGSWTGLDDYEGVVIDLTRRGPSFQVGTGANDRPNEQDIYGASAWFDWTLESQANACSHTPGLCIEHDSYGDLNIRLDCAVGGPVACTSDVNETHKHAFYLPNFNGDGVLDRYDLENGAQFVRNADGTARLTGVIFKQGEPNYRFAIDVMLSGGTDVPPPGSPYNPYGANPADWFYYPNWSGELEGLTWNTGANLTLERYGASFQIGTGANAHPGETDIYGGSGWFDWTTNSQPNDCHYYNDCIRHEGNGDINVQIEQCPL
ncbi:MAG: SdrD B-like domain-containing protein, partial [Gammaproteobacteria bacterium]